ncbi:MAG: glycoside hydrolase family 65 protein [Bacillota bacterium]
MLSYNFGSGKEKNWLLTETSFQPNALGKCETIMALGNGYMGLRSSLEESYLRQTRNTFVAGTFNRFDETESTELPNAADTVELEIVLNGERFSLEKGTIQSYIRYINLKTGELVRKVVWESPKNEVYQCTFRRFTSLNNLHLAGMKVEITPLSGNAAIQVTSGINGQMTNSGAQHFHEGEKRIFDKEFLQLIQTTTESKIDFIINAKHSWKKLDEKVETSPKMTIGRRKVDLSYRFEVEKDTTLIMEKISTIHTSRDKEVNNKDYQLEVLRETSLAEIKNESAKGYEALFAESVEKWNDYWLKADVEIESVNEFDLLAIRFAAYHMLIMTPFHDSRFGIGAKGLTGEGYKGHSFWDSEIFILPYFLYTKPEIARSLLEYRYHTIAGARKKAKDNGYQGAMYPWESAFTGEEETPEWAAVNILTGKATKVWSGFIEQHITADIAYALWNYYSVTNDVDFMDQYGSEMLFDTATFWASRVKWDEKKSAYVIYDVVGPDEYKEHVDNNAFTNYMAHWVIETSIKHFAECKEHSKVTFERLSKSLDLENRFQMWKEVVDKIYLPQPGDHDLIPQDDTYLSKPIINIEKYKTASSVQTILQDFSREQVNELQVSKQADIVMLLYVLENLFSDKVKKANLSYYEAKTIHDSSLSMAVHSIVASAIKDKELAYSCFQTASVIDLGQNMISSDAGIHAASLGGIWKAIVFGFVGIRTLHGQLHITPRLPKEWKTLKLQIHWRGDQLEIKLTHEKIVITNKSMNKKEIELIVNGEKYTLTKPLQILTK